MIERLKPARHIPVLLISTMLMVVLGCNRTDDSARQAEEAEARALTAMTEDIRPLVALCEQLGMAREPPDVSKVLVIDLKDGACREPPTLVAVAPGGGRLTYVDVN
jgi:hypothetical protein